MPEIKEQSQLNGNTLYFFSGGDTKGYFSYGLADRARGQIAKSVK